MPSAAALMSTSAQTRKPRQRSPLEKERDLFRIEELHLKGYTVGEISTLLDITKRQIAFDLGELTRRYGRANERSVQRDLNQQLRKIDFLEREAWRAYEASKSEREITTRRTRSKDDSRMQEVGKRLEQRDGDVRYLTVIQWCIDKRNVLLNLYPEADRGQKQLQPVNEIVYELPAAQQVPALQPQAPKALRAGARERPPRPVEMSPTELWGDEGEDVLVIEANPPK